MSTPSPIQDLSSFDTKAPAEAGTTVQLENPHTNEPLFDNDGLPVTVTIMGEDAGKVRDYVRRMNDARYEKLNKGRGWDLSSEKVENEGARKLAIATLAWHIPFPLDGQPLGECKESTAYRLYSDPRFAWIPEQLAKAMTDRKRFFRNGSGT